MKKRSSTFIDNSAEPWFLLSDLCDALNALAQTSPSPHQQQVEEYFKEVYSALDRLKELSGFLQENKLLREEYINFFAEVMEHTIEKVDYILKKPTDHPKHSTIFISLQEEAKLKMGTLVTTLIKNAITQKFINSDENALAELSSTALNKGGNEQQKLNSTGSLIDASNQYYQDLAEAADKIKTRNVIEDGESFLMPSHEQINISPQNLELFGKLSGCSVVGLEECYSLLHQITIIESMYDDFKVQLKTAFDTGHLQPLDPAEHSPHHVPKLLQNFAINEEVTKTEILVEILNGLSIYGSPAMRKLITDPDLSLEKLFTEINKHISDIKRIIAMSPTDLREYIAGKGDDIDELYSLQKKAGDSSENDESQFMHLRQLSSIAKNVLATKEYVEALNQMNPKELHKAKEELGKEVREWTNELRDGKKVLPILEQKMTLFTIAQTRLRELNAIAGAKRDQNSAKELKGQGLLGGRRGRRPAQEPKPSDDETPKDVRGRKNSGQ